MPMELQIDLLRGGLAVPLKIFTIVTLGSEQKNPPDAGGKSDRESTTGAALRNGKFQIPFVLVLVFLLVLESVWRRVHSASVFPLTPA